MDAPVPSEAFPKHAQNRASSPGTGSCNRTRRSCLTSRSFASTRLPIDRRQMATPERTLLSNGILLSALDSRLDAQNWRATPHLAISY